MIEKSSYRTLAKDLTAIRKKWNMRQRDVAEILKCDPLMITRYETGTHRPSLSTMIRWADSMGYDLALKQRNT